MRRALLLLGTLCALMGALWIAQGLGWLNWPRSSFMLGRTAWADRGAALAVCGLLLVLVARRVRR
jgi:hypothetical protein